MSAGQRTMTGCIGDSGGESRVGWVSGKNLRVRVSKCL